MQRPADQQIFGMIPKPGGSCEHGNMPFLLHEPLNNVYLDGLMESGVFPEHIHGSYTYDPDVRGEKARMRSHAEGNLVIPIYKEAFYVADAIIEEHLEKTNGYIRRFPPVQLEAYPNIERKFDYFEYHPRDYVPAAEERLEKAYGDIHQNCGSKVKRQVIWWILATLALALVLLGGRIYSLIPQLGAWTSESRVNFYIQIGVILVFLEIIGCFVPGSWWNVDFTNHTLGFLVMLGAVFAWGYMYFPGTTGPAPDDGTVNVIYHLVKWPYIAYFAIIWIFYTVHAISALRELAQYRKNLNGFKKTFAQIFEEDFYRLYRYVRLRQLWAEHENMRTPYWVSRIDQRLYQYQEEYDKTR